MTTIETYFNIPTGADVTEAFVAVIHERWQEIGADWIEACQQYGDRFDYNKGASVEDIIDNCCGSLPGFMRWWELVEDELRAEIISRVGILSA
jgi:hypothetical protein